MGPRFFLSHPKDRPIQSPLTTHKGKWRIYSNLNSHGSPFSHLLRQTRGYGGTILTWISTGCKYQCRGSQHLTDYVEGDTDTSYQETCQGDTISPSYMQCHGHLFSVYDTARQVSSDLFSATDTCDTRIPSSASFRPEISNEILYGQPKCSVHP
jgi:hypothetical protein